MTRAEVLRLLGWVTANFPHMQEKDLRPTAELWYRTLSDIPYEAAEMGVLKILTTAKYFPTVAEVREAAMSLMTPQLPTAGEAWGEVLNAIRIYGYYRPEEAFEAMSPLTRRVVEYIGWPEICLEDEVAVRAHFMRVYEQCRERERELALVTPEIREVIQGMAERTRLPGTDSELRKLGPGDLTNLSVSIGDRKVPARLRKEA